MQYSQEPDLTLLIKRTLQKDYCEIYSNLLAAIGK